MAQSSVTAPKNLSSGAKARRVRQTDKTRPLGHLIMKRPAFVGIPKRLCLAPPIAHRGQVADSSALTPFAFGVLAAVLVAGREAWNEQRHRAALAEGHDKIAEEREAGERYKAAVRAAHKARRRGETVTMPRPRHTRPDGRRMKPAKAIPMVGRKQYKQARERLREQLPPPTIDVTLTRFALLRWGRLSDNASNAARLDSALDRLTRPVGYGDDKPYEPPLAQWCATGSGKLQLTVRGEWLEGPFHRFPLPLPLRGATTLALFAVPARDQNGRHQVEHAAVAVRPSAHAEFPSGYRLATAQCRPRPGQPMAGRPE